MRPAARQPERLPRSRVAPVVGALFRFFQRILFLDGKLRLVADAGTPIAEAALSSFAFQPHSEAYGQERRREKSREICCRGARTRACRATEGLAGAGSGWAL